MADPRSWARHPVLPFAFLVVLCAAMYGKSLSRPFVSEDFLHLREAAQTSLAESIRVNSTGPLMGVTFVHFYRPLAPVLFHAQYSLWGIWPPGYLGAQLLFHILNVVLVYRLAARWTASSISTFGVALVFALFPLHPNTVLFVAAFPLLVSTTLALASFLLYERFRESDAIAGLIAPAVPFSLALGCYEQAAIVPLLILSREFLLTGPRPCRRLLIRRTAPFFGILSAYALVRYAALGQLVGGYPGFRQRLLGSDVLAVSRDVVRGLARLAYPALDSSRAWPVGIAVLLVLLLGSLWSLSAWRRRSDTPRIWTFGVLWVFATWAPFAFVQVVPGNGRYWYLTSIGLGLLFVAAAQLAAKVLSRTGLPLAASTTVLILIMALGLHYLTLLAGYTELYRQAGDTAATIRRSLSDLGEQGFERVFVTGHPAFVSDSRGTLVAQVFHWGLSDALARPLTSRSITIYPLPQRSDIALLPVLERQDLGIVRRWNPESSALEDVISSTDPEDRLEARRESSGAGLMFRGTPATEYRLVVLTRGNSSIHPVTEQPDADGWTEVYPPAAFVCSMGRLYTGAIYAWIEELRPDGRHGSVSRLHEIDCPQ